MKRFLLLLVVLLAALYVAMVIVVPAKVDERFTRVLNPPPYDRASAPARALHERLLVADLHADALIWKRDLLARNDRGQVDLPRLQDANVALQVFSVPTKVPRHVERINTSADQLDLLSVAAFAQGLPPTTWFRLDSRALAAAKRLEQTAAKSNGSLAVVRTKTDLTNLLLARSRGEKTIGGILALEGLHCVEGDARNVDRFFQAGYRIAGLVHQFDNDLGGSSQGVTRGGLTPLGREVVRRMNERGMIIDLAHASPQLIRDVLDATKGPILVSHTGVRGTCDRPRNLSDREIQRIAARGGVIGIGFWSGAVCGSDAKAIAKAIRHAANLGGVTHVALGSDFDGDKMPFDATGLVGITDALLAEGFREEEIRKIMGGNVIRLLTATLPD